MKKGILIVIVGAALAAVSVVAVEAAPTRQEASPLQRRVAALERKTRALQRGLRLSNAAVRTANARIQLLAGRVTTAETRLACFNSTVSTTRYSQSGLIQVSTGIHNWNDTATGGRNVPASFTGSFGQVSDFQLDLTHAGDPVHYRLVAVSSACPTLPGLRESPRAQAVTP